MVKNSKKSAGEISVELASSQGDSYEVENIREEWSKDYCKCIEQKVLEGKEKYLGNFFVVIETKRERLMPNIIRNFILHRCSCPTPHYDQIVYRYVKEIDGLEFIWAIPDKEKARDMRDFPFDWPDQRELLNDVLSFYEGSLGRKAMLLNGELTEDREKVQELTKEIYG